MNAKERRRDPRLSIAVSVNVASGDNFFAGLTRDISAGGLFIETDVGLAVGHPLRVSLDLSGRRFTLEAEVAWALFDEGRSVGIGVHFTKLARPARRAIEVFMRKRAPMLFDMMPDDDDDDPDPEES